MSKLCDTFVSSDIADHVDGLAPNETYVKADITYLEAMVSLLDGMEMVVHFGPVGDEAPIEAVCMRNLSCAPVSNSRAMGNLA